VVYGSSILVLGRHGACWIDLAKIQGQKWSWKIWNHRDNLLLLQHPSAHDMLLVLSWAQKTDLPFPTSTLSLFH
jgi:hypothetical protein